MSNAVALKLYEMHTFMINLVLEYTYRTYTILRSLNSNAIITPIKCAYLDAYPCNV